MKLIVMFDVWSYSRPQDIFFHNSAMSSMYEKQSDAKRYVAIIEIPDFIPLDSEKGIVLEVKEEP